MNEKMTQEQRLDYLIEEFRADSEEYRYVKIPGDTERKRRLLRSLMNVRIPRNMAEDTVKIQDDYLKARAEEKGIVGLGDILSAGDAFGSTNPYAGTISVWQGDITRLKVDAVVNAANSQMLGCFIPMHTCIDNCIHSFAGIQLRAECDRNMNRMRARFGRQYEQPAAVPMLTDAYNLPSKKVIHIVGPIVRYGLDAKLKKDLADCYRNTLDICAENGLKSVAFCCISTGVFRFPNRRAAEIAVRSVTEWLSKHSESMERVIFNVFKDEDREYYEEELR